MAARRAAELNKEIDSAFGNLSTTVNPNTPDVIPLKSNLPVISMDRMVDDIDELMARRRNRNTRELPDTPDVIPLGGEVAPTSNAPVPFNAFWEERVNALDAIVDAAEREEDLWKNAEKAERVKDKIEAKRHKEVIESLDNIEDASESRGGGIIGGLLGKLKGQRGKGGLLDSAINISKKGASLLGRTLIAGFMLKVSSRMLETTDFTPVVEGVKKFFHKAATITKEKFQEGADLYQGIMPEINTRLNTGIDKVKEFLVHRMTDAFEILSNPIDLTPVGLMKDTLTLGVKVGKFISDKITQFFEGVETFIGDFLSNNVPFGSDIAEALGMRTTAQVKEERVQAARQRIAERQKLISAGEYYNQPVDGKRASGGPVRAGGDFLVGENGPEVFSPTKNGEILPINLSNLESASSLESSIANAIQASATEEIRRKDSVHQMQQITKVLSSKEGGGGSGFKGRRSIDSSPITSSDIGLIMVVGGGV
jgi:hypothetical protein